MLFSKLRIAAAVLAAAGTLAWLAVAGTSQSLANADGPPANASKRAAAAPGDGDKPESTVELRGRVLDKASGQPVAGASLALSTDPPASGSAGRAARATTDSQGSFSFRAGASGKPTPFKVIARATGYASDWAAVTPAQPGEITFRLPKDDVPIEGRIVDLEGRPVADVNIQLGPIFKSDDSDLAPYFEKVKKEDLYYGAADFGLLPSASASDLGLLSGQTTDADGRFRMTGIGRDRVVHLIIRGKSIEHDYQRVVTRNDLKDLPKTFHPAQFVHQSAPSKPIVGTVRIKGTGKPAVGVTISMDGHQQAKTDDEGHYRLDGVAKRRQYSLWAQGDSFFTLLKMGIADTPGLEPLTVDLEISRGMPIKGRVLDKDTGRPVKANVEFFPYSHNPHLKDYAPTPGIYQGVKTRDDGTFTVVGIPGPGLLGVRTEGGAYLAADTTLIDRLPKTDYGFPMTAPEANPGDYNAMVPIDEPGEDSPSRIHELRVQAGRSIDVELVDLDGNPVSGAHVAGREPKRQAMGPIPGKDSRKISGSKFTATGLASDHGRYLVIVDPSRKLGKLQAVRAGETSSIKIALEPLGSFKGRIVDPKGQPQAGLEVRAGAPRALTRYWKDDPALPEEVMFGFDQPGALPERFGGEAKTAADGTFVIEGLIPGFPYVIQINQAGQRNAFAEHFSEGVPTKAGATKDLGDLKFGGS